MKMFCSRIESLLSSFPSFSQRMLTRQAAILASSLLLGGIGSTMAQSTVYVQAVTGASAGTPTPSPLYVETNPGVYTLGSTTKVTATGLDSARGGSRFIREGATANVSGFTVSPTLVPGTTYKVSIATTSASRSSNLSVGISVTGCTTTMPATSTAWRSGASGAGGWQDLGNITVNAGVTNPTVKFSYVSGTLVTASARFWSDGYRFEPVIVNKASITSQPQSITRNAGSNATFSVTATGTAPITYQWQFNGSNIPGATAATLALSNVQSSNAGPYLVAVTNPGGTTNSATATLTVTPVAPYFTVQPPASRSADQGTSIAFSASAVGTQPISYQWQFGGSDIPGATTSSYTKSNLQLSDSGVYVLVASNSVGVTSSSNSQLTVTNDAPVIATQPQPQTVNAGTTATFSVAANGANPKTYQWRLEGTNIPNATASSYSVNNAQQPVAGNYSVIIGNIDGSTTSSNALLTVVETAPVVTVDPVASQTIGSGSSASFSVSTRGTDPRSYQWQFENVDISGATTNPYTRSNAQVSDSGSYRVIISNAFGTATSAVSTLIVTNAGPVIIAQPQPRTNDAGTVASFSVSAQGSSLSYQWRHQGTNLAGATGSSYNVPNAQQVNAGNYSVVITNSQGATTSDNALLTIIDKAPTITVQPTASQTVFAGASPSFSVTTLGSDPRSYQWKFNNVNISGATQSTYTRNNAQTTDSGTYVVVVSNFLGFVTSSPAQLVVNPPPPTITQQPQGRTVPAGSNVTVSVVASSQIPMTYQWRFNTVNISGATGSSYTRTNAQTSHTGNYSVIVSNASGFVTSGNALITVTNSQPIIVAHPTSRTIYAGDTTTFAVESLGSDPRRYQWRFNGNAIAGATNSFFTLSDAQSTNQGNYSVNVSNSLGQATSTNASLSILEAAPILLSQPNSRKVSVGSCVTFSVNVSGSRPMQFQWMFNGAPIPGAYDSAFTLYDVVPAHAGTFSVSMTNILGAAISTNVTLTVVTNPLIDSVIRNGNNVFLSWSAVPDRTYRVEYSDNLTSWSPLTADAPATDCTSTATDSSAPQNQRYYRVILLP